MMEVVGSRLVLQVNWRDEGESLMMLIDWQEGRIVISESAEAGIWGGFVFLNSDIIVVPNIFSNALEVLDCSAVSVDNLPQTKFKRLVILMLPTLRPDSIVSRISCRSDPNPLGPPLDNRVARTREQLYRKSPQLFSPSPESAIIVFYLAVHGFFPDSQRLRNLSRYSFVVHRSAILDVALNQPSLLRNEAGIEILTDELDGIPAIPWKLWGPHLTRWSGGDEVLRYITVTAGQRLAATVNRGIVIRDFNPYAVKLTHRRPLDSNVLENGTRVEKGTAILQGSDVFFVEAVVSSLPYVETVWDYVGSCEGVLMDEEHVVILSRDIWNGKYIDVFPI